MAGNTIYVQGSYVDIHDNEVVNLSLDKAQVRLDHPAAPEAPDGDAQPQVGALVASVEAVRPYFWADSAMAVVFAVCRDCFGYPDNMSQFEREFGCAEGLISNTFRHNPYMRLPIDKWARQGVKQRVLRLCPRQHRELLRAIVSVRLGISFYRINLQALDAAYTQAFPKSTPINVNKKKATADKK